MQRRHIMRVWCLALAVLCVTAAAAPAHQAVRAAAASNVEGASAVLPGGQQTTYLPLVRRSNPPVVDLSVSRVEMIQATTMKSEYRVHVAQRPAILRVFVGLAGATQLDGVRARLTRYANGSARDSLLAGPITVLASPPESSLSHTLNFDLPPSWLTPGTAFVLALDPDNEIPETDEANNRYPPAGQQSFDFVPAPPLEIVIVPVIYQRPDAPAPTTPPLADLSYLTWMPFKVLPVSNVSYSVRSVPLYFGRDLRAPDGSGWVALLDAITSIHNYEDPNQSKVYYALVDSVVADGCSGGCIAGIGWLNQPGRILLKSAAGFAGFPTNRPVAGSTLTHELGHLFGRPHAPCGVTNAGYFPYSDAFIGQWGYDSATGTLYNPAVHHDYMSYCDPEWTSDYTYRSIFDAWSWVARTYASPTTTSDWSLIISGSVDEAGELTVGPAFRGPATPDVAGTAGRYTAVLVDAVGRELAARNFDTVHFALEAGEAAEMRDGFRVALPALEAATGLMILDGERVVFERRSTGSRPILGAVNAASLSGDGAHVYWTAASAGPLAYQVLFSPDGGRSWQLLARDFAQSRVSLPQSLLSAALRPKLLIQASDGVRVSEALFEVQPND
jgi:hypothetical protein